MMTRKSSKVTSPIFMKYYMIAKKKKNAERWSVHFSWHLARTSLRHYPILMTPYKNIFEALSHPHDTLQEHLWGIILFSWHLTKTSLRHYPILMTPYIYEALSHSHDTLQKHHRGIIPFSWHLTRTSLWQSQWPSPVPLMHHNALR